MNMKIGFIGCGNMAQGMIKGIIESNIINSEYIYASDPSKEILTMMQEKYGINISTENIDVVTEADILIFAVKPNVLEKTITLINNKVKEECIIVSIAAGKSIEFIKRCFNREVKVVRVMPNSGVQVGEGMSALCANERVTENELDKVMKIFGSFGKTVNLEEKLFDGITAVSGSSPAIIYILIEALADAAVRTGIPRQEAYTIVAQTVMGSAKALLETNKHPGQLKDMVCSPGGTSIEAVYEVESGGLRGIIMDAIEAATEKSKIL